MTFIPFRSWIHQQASAASLVDTRHLAGTICDCGGIKPKGEPQCPACLRAELQGITDDYAEEERQSLTYRSFEEVFTCHHAPE
jgi:hypothetical protein